MKLIKNCFIYETNRTYSSKSQLAIVLFFSMIILNSTYDYIKCIRVQKLSCNFWDIIFRVLCNPINICGIVLLTFIFLIKDITLDYESYDMLLIRVSSRKLWWNVKVLILLSKTLKHILMFIFICIIIAFSIATYTNSWSETILKAKQFNISDTNTDIITILNVVSSFQTPIKTFFQVIILFFLGFLSIGLFVMFITLISNNRIVGTMCGILTWIISFIPISFDKYSIVNNVTCNHLNYIFHNIYGFNSSYPYYKTSIIYWSSFIIIVYFLGLVVSCKRNYMRNI